MTGGTAVSDELRVLVVAPTGRDGELLQATLAQAGVRGCVCRDALTLQREFVGGAAAVLLAEEALDPRGRAALSALVARQPPWSDLSVLVLTRHGADSPGLSDIVSSLGNVTLLERPIRMAALVTAVRAAVRARERQYQNRAFLAQQLRTEQALREADRRKDEFLATLAHELRNPLAPLRNALHLLQVPGAPADSANVVALMDRQIGYLVRLVDDLLEVSRITRGSIELRPERIALAQVVHDAVETSRPLIEAAGHELVVSLPDEPLVLEADPVRLTQVFANLLNNASRYTDGPGRITLAARRRDGFVEVVVRDTGIGIAAELLPRVFEMFAQGEPSAGRSRAGLGIGLTLARSLVQLHGGEVTAASEGPGRGSEFVVRLPLARRASGPLGEPRAPDQPPGAWRAPQVGVLVVDDNRDAADSVALVLRAYGADVAVAYDGAAAIDLVVSRRPAVVLLDIGMPGMDGYEVARSLRRLPHGGELVLVALTGWGQEEDRRRSRLAGFDHHFVKPVDLTALRTLLRSLDEDGRGRLDHASS